MNDYKLKMIITILSAIVFSFVIVLTAFLIPLDNQKKQQTYKAKPKNRLEAISASINNK